ncbi:MAG: transglutaminase domain-containing protein [Clostridiales bacterium]|jgi:hypothetical protein|nr:transglutaminase domain-containing protein [Clostridiales bacterium]
MSHDSKRGYQIYYSLLGMILTLAIILWVNDYFILKVNIFACILYSIVPAVLIYIFNRYRKNTVSYLVLLSLLPLVGLIFLISRTNPIKWISEIIDWVIRYDRTEDLYEAMGAYSVLAAVSLVASILFYMIVKRLMTRMLLGAVIITIFIVFSVFGIHIGKVAVGVGVFYILNILIELSGMLYGKRTGNKDRKESILYLIPVCILLAFIAVSLPSKAEPIQWTGVKNVYYTIKDSINKLVTEWEFFVAKGEGIFSISLSGYSDDGSLDNEDLIENHKVALIVTGRRGLSPIYLTGSVNDIYTGYSWEKNKEDYLEDELEYQMDYGELLYGLSRLDPLILEENRLVGSKTMDIIYNDIKTRTFFYPSKTKWYSFNSEVHNLEAEQASITFPKAKGDKTKYNISYYEMNLEGKAFQDMLRQADEFSYDESRNIDYEKIKSIQNEFSVKYKDEFVLNRDDFYELYKERADIIYNSYTQLPDNFPQRVTDLALEITKDKDSRYDKLKAIEAYLLKLEYSYSPGKKPEDADFVDYFLFDNRKGYCTSFATAMAVLGRSIGIPTRYIEGFVVNYEDKDDTGFLVRNSHAHTWVEAYFDGVGWIPFEATPPFYEQRYKEWAPIRRSEDGGNSSYYNIEDMIPPMEEITDIGVEPEAKDGRSSTLLWLLIFLSMMLVLVVILITYYLILRRRYQKEFDASDYSRKTYQLFLRILTLLRYEGFTLDAQDTLLMLSERVRDRYQYEDITFSDVINIFMAYRYGELMVTDKQFDKVSTFHEGLVNTHENETKALKLHMEEFLFLVRGFSHSANHYLV